MNDNKLLYSSSDWHNPLFVLGLGISFIQFYNDETEAIARTYKGQTSCKWFGSKYSSNSRHKQIRLQHPVSKRRKLNFTRKEHFIDMGTHGLYLYTPHLKNFKHEDVHTEDDYKNQYQDEMSFDAMTTGEDYNNKIFTESRLTIRSFIDTQYKPLHEELAALKKKYFKYDTVSVSSIKKMYEDGIIKLPKSK